MIDDSDSALRITKPEKDSASARILTFDKIRCGPKPEPVVLRFHPEKALFERTLEDPISLRRPKLAEVVETVRAAGTIKLALLVERLGDRGYGKKQAARMVEEAFGEGLISRPLRGVYSVANAALFSDKQTVPDELPEGEK